jgi:hypothetical protein
VKIVDIKSHLQPYSIVQRRKTTINHAFASALAPYDQFDVERITLAMSALGQNNLDKLLCVYCAEPAETWDHLVGLVKKTELNGYGHQIGNLVPCCKTCNSLKGNRDWREFLRSQIKDETKRQQLEQLLSCYLQEFATEIDLVKARAERTAEWERYAQIKQQIINLMAEADRLADELRLQSLKHAPTKSLADR